MSLFKLDDHYNQTPYRYEGDAPSYFVAPMHCVFNNKAYQAYYFRQPESKRIMMEKKRWR